MMFSHEAMSRCLNMMLIKPYAHPTITTRSLHMDNGRAWSLIEKCDWWVVYKGQKMEKRRIGRGREVQGRKVVWEARFADTENIERGEELRERRKESESVRYDSKSEWMVRE